MKLHHRKDELEELIELTSNKTNIPTSAIRKDYYITIILENLAKSDYVEYVVFKGGTSLSKCYPGSINRFSEDIDLTYVPEEKLSNKKINKNLKDIEKTLIGEAKFDIIREERNDRNKSSIVWFNDAEKETEKIKLEIGSCVRPNYFTKRVLKSHIHEYLESIDEIGAIKEYRMSAVKLNVLDIRQTFIDKIMAVKRHAICGTLSNKVRHIYDVVKLLELEEIQKFLRDSQQLKSIYKFTKKTDLFYLGKRNIPVEYNPEGSYDFEIWESEFNNDVKRRYETLHKELLYTDEKQEFSESREAFVYINQVLKKIER